jgi:hypothetical protein
MDNPSGAIESEVVPPIVFSLLQDAREHLFNIIRPECLTLVEAHNLSDNILRSAIGSSDG